MESLYSYFKESGMGGVAKSLKGQYFEKQRETLYPQSKMNLLKRWKSVLEYDRELNLLKRTLKDIEEGGRSGPVQYPLQNTSTYKKILRFGHSQSIRCFSLHPTQPFLLTGGNDKKILSWNIQQGMVVREITDHTASVTAISFQKNGERFASANDRTFEVYVWEYATFLRLRRIQMRDHTNEITRICFGNRFCVTSSLDGTVRSWNVSNNYEMNLCHRGERITSLDLSETEKEVVFGDTNGKVFIVNTTTTNQNSEEEVEQEENKCIFQHSGELEFLRILKLEDDEESEGEIDELILSGAKGDQEIIVSSVTDRTIKHKIKMGQTKVKDGCFVGEKGKFVVLLFRDLRMKVFRVSDGKLMKTLKIETTVATSEPIGVNVVKNKLFHCDEKCIRIYPLD